MGPESTAYVMGELTELYQCIEEYTGQQFLTREVIFLDERISHANESEHHPQSFDEYGDYVPEIIRQPDYILSGNKFSSYCLLKQIGTDRFKLILWVKTVGSPESYQNSVHSFWRIGERKWNQLLRNKKILYKYE